MGRNSLHDRRPRRSGKRPVLMQGPTSSGKTSMVEYLPAPRPAVVTPPPNNGPLGHLFGPQLRPPPRVAHYSGPCSLVESGKRLNRGWPTIWTVVLARPVCPWLNPGCTWWWSQHLFVLSVSSGQRNSTLPPSQAGHPGPWGARGSADGPPLRPHQQPPQHRPPLGGPAFP